MNTQGRTKRAMAVKFFAQHAGFSYDPKTETPAQGKARGARRLAAAEAWAKAEGLEVVWEPEQANPVDVFGEPDPVNGPFYDPDAEFFCAVLCRPCSDHGTSCRHAEVLASLGMIADPSLEYRRVVEAELALEAMPA